MKTNHNLMLGAFAISSILGGASLANENNQEEQTCTLDETYDTSSFEDIEGCLYNAIDPETLEPIQNPAITVTESGKVISTDSPALFLTGDGNKLVNHGTIQGSVSSAIIIAGDGSEVRNTGLIVSNAIKPAHTGLALHGNNNTVVNSGTIGNPLNNEEHGGFTKGLSVAGLNLNVLNEASGVIEATNYDPVGISMHLNDDGNLEDQEFGENKLVNNGRVIAESELADGTATGIYVESVDGPSASIINNGFVTATGSNAFGIEVKGTGHSVVNSGSVIATSTAIWQGDTPNEEATYAIRAKGGNNYIENTGLIENNGANSNSYGVDIDGSNSSVVNRGTVKVTANNSVDNYGIKANGSESSIENIGDIITIAGNNATSRGIDAVSSDGSFVNSGTITVTGGDDGANNGIHVEGSGNSFNNSGTITITGGGNSFNGGIVAGVPNSYSGITVVNSGDITITSGDNPKNGGNTGIYVAGSGSSVVNSGAITVTGGDDSYSIKLAGGNNTLTLNEGTQLIGMVGLEESDTLNVNMTQDMHLHTMGTPGTINFAKTHVVLDDGIMFLNLDGYGAYDQIWSNTGRVVADSVGARRSSMNTEADGSWANISGVNHESGSTLAGTWGWGDDISKGVFVGAFYSDTNVPSSFEIDKGIGFHGGTYGQLGNAEYTLAFGVSNVEIDHEFAHMGASTEKPNSKAKARYLTSFISPALAWSDSLGTGENVRLRYTGIMHGAHNFDYGSGHKMKVDRRMSHEVEAGVSWTQQLKDLPANSMVRYGFDVGMMQSDTVNIEFNGNGGKNDFDETSYSRAFVGLDMGGAMLQVAYDNNDELSFGFGASF